MHLVPHELYVGEVFFPPMLLDAALGLVAATITARLSNRFRVSRYFYQSVAGADRADRDLHRPVLHLSDSGVRA